jgi:hypothetical protein
VADDLEAQDPDAQRRRDFRAWVRAHHPDAGGDPDAFAAGLLTWRRDRDRAGTAPAARTEVTVFRARHGMWQLARWWRRRHRSTRVR